MTSLKVGMCSVDEILETDHLQQKIQILLDSV